MIFIVPYYCEMSAQLGYTHLTADERPEDWIAMTTPEGMAHDLLEHLAGPRQEIQALGSYYHIRGQWDNGRTIMYDIVSVIETATIEDLPDYESPDNELFEPIVIEALENCEHDHLDEWIRAYPNNLVQKLVQALTKGYHDAIKAYGEGTEAYDHYQSVVEALRTPMSEGGAFYINLETYETITY